MKRIICIVLSVIMLSSVSFAQTQGKDPKKAKATTEKKAPAKKDDAGKDTKGTKLKKDGTPDMRYKENKDAAKKQGKTKKDGTPDMRYKENKDAAKKNNKK
jgi:hypothetical protein